MTFKFIDQRGASLVEYSLLVSLIAVIVIAGVRTTGTKTQCRYESISAAMSGGSASCGETGYAEDEGGFEVGIPEIPADGTAGELLPG